jgi:class 3 adenylate cyclase/tetratricopeptide (TPR) repeat protein
MAACARCGSENPDGAKFCNECGNALVQGAPPREQRKVVTVLFCDVVDSTRLGESTDPETLRTLLAQYFERMSRIVERHGGSVEKFIGDAVMAVFGVPRVHEDDALRACRAAVEMGVAFPGLSLEGRIGIATGEVVTGTAERLATGDAVNVAARLQQAARPGEILVGQSTSVLVRDVAELEPLPPLKLKGKAQPVAAYRLLSVGEDAARRHGAPLVGREREQRLLEDAWGRVVSGRSCHLFTVLGAAGVGKSRLVAEFLSTLDPALVVRGRCLSYGEGITYWPVVEVVKQLPQANVDEAAAQIVHALLGVGELVSSSAEIAWAFRKHLEAVSLDRPLVCVFDDLHWGEETFLDLVEHVADLSRESPILLLCMGRPELLDRRPAWAGGKLNATNVLLEPLSQDETAALIDSLGDLEGSLRARILETAEGNPLFVEEMVALVRDARDGAVSVPPTIHALLAARLDQLDVSERGVLERGAVEGRVFHRGAVQALGPDEPDVPERLTSLVRKELVRPDRAQLPGEDAYRFRHLLIRDAAYDALPKGTRAQLHERFALWLERHGAGLVELDEILGYHLEQASRWRDELGSHDASLGLRAAERLGAAGRRALGRGDIAAAANLLDRAAALTPADAPERGELLVQLAGALFRRAELARADGVLTEAIASAQKHGNTSVELRARLERGIVLAQIDPEGRAAELRHLAEEALPVFETLGDELGLATAWLAIAVFHHTAARVAPRQEALERALVHARSAGDGRFETMLQMALSAGMHWGPLPADEGVRRSRAVLESAPASRLVEAAYTGALAMGEAMRGKFAEARELIARASQIHEEIGNRLGVSNMHDLTGTLEMLAGNFEAAAREYRQGFDFLDEIGEKGFLSSRAGFLAQALCAQGLYDEAERFAAVCEDAAASDDTEAQVLWRQARGKVLVARGDGPGGEALLREAVERASTTDDLNLTAGAVLDLGDVLRERGATDEAAATTRRALALYRRKGNVVMAARAQQRLAELGLAV